jgi:hypothetical protein
MAATNQKWVGKAMDIIAGQAPLAARPVFVNVVVASAPRLVLDQRGREVEEEAGGIAVCLVEGESGGAELRVLPSAMVDPSAEQHGFPEAGRGETRLIAHPRF